MMNELSVFNFQGKPVRAVKDENGEPWFVAKDVCAALELGNPSQAVSALDEDERSLISNEALRTNGPVVVINESGLYTLTLRCRDAVKPGKLAYKFRKWVTAEVLPAIRRDSGYLVARPNEPDEVLLARAVIVANAAIERQKKRITELENTVTEMTPHAEYSKKVLASENLHTVNSIGVHLGISAQKLNKFLVAQGWIYKQGLVYCPAAKIRDLGYCDYHIVPYNACGEIHTREHLKWTEKGRKAVIELWNTTNGVLPMAI